MQKQKLKLHISYFRSHNSEAGFTLIEVMIATGLFVVIMTIGIGAVLNVNSVYKKTQKIRSIVDNLGFVMEDMSKTLRTGVSYACPDAAITAGTSFTIPGLIPCVSKNYAISFQSASGLPVVYAIVPFSSTDVGIYKSIDGGLSFIRLTPPEVIIDQTKSGFTVVGDVPFAFKMIDPARFLHDIF